MRNLLFTVSEQSWAEHESVGIAAINDADLTYQKVAAMSELGGIRRGDRVIFYVQQKKSIIGLFEIVTSPFFDSSLLIPNAEVINQRFPYRVGFKESTRYPNPISIEDLWIAKDEGKIWSLQQSRGDVIGRHACMGISKVDFDYILGLFERNNVLTANPEIDYTPPGPTLEPLPLDYRINNNGSIHYEKTLEYLLCEYIADGCFREKFGEFDDFIPYYPTSGGKEIDLLLVKYSGNSIRWMEVIELKADTFTMAEMQKLIFYEKWLNETQAKPHDVNVYPIAIAYRYSDEVIEYVIKRVDYLETKIRLLTYEYDPNSVVLTLNEVG